MLSLLNSENSEAASELLDLECALELEIAGDLARDSLYEFTKLMWRVIDPAPFKNAWHIKAICDHLEAVTRGDIQNLLINVPPGHAKSLITAVMWPAWVWIKNPETKWMFSSYASSLSVRDSVKCRQVIESPQYKFYFKPKWKLTDDQNLKERFTNTAHGFRMATSVDGVGTGERADYIVGDDLLKVGDAESVVMRTKANDHWTNTMATRDTDPKTTRRVLIMQRLHEKDAAAAVLALGTYDHLLLPAEYDPKRAKTTKIGWSDPRTTEGELLWPGHIDAVVIGNLKTSLGSRGYAGQYAQSPMSADGGLFKRLWWQYFNPAVRPMNGIIRQYWDCAQKPGISNDYSVCATWLHTATGHYLLDLWREKVEAPDLERTAISMSAKWKPSQIVVEDKSAGSSLIQYLKRKNMPVFAYQPHGDKQVRASAAAPTVEARNCHLPDGAPWLEDFIAEHEKFPSVDHDDQVDTTSMMVDHWNNNMIAQPGVRSL